LTGFRRMSLSYEWGRTCDTILSSKCPPLKWVELEV
jgi:hypothetical protein